MRTAKRRNIYLVRQHLQVGDELILTAYLDKSKAEAFANHKEFANEH